MNNYKAGYIQKKGAKNGAWKTRWMVTEPDGLGYYKKENKNKMGSIDLREAEEVKIVDGVGKSSYIFHIVTKDRVWMIGCTSSYDREQWVSVIERKRSALNRPRNPTVSLNIASASSVNEEKVGGKQTLYASARADVRRPSAPALQDKIEGGVNKLHKTASVRAIKNKAENLTRSVSKFKQHVKTNFSDLPQIGKLYVSIEEANFSGKVDPNAKPIVSAHFEQQYITSVPTKNASNPRWKDNFLFHVCRLESKFKLKIIDSTTNSVMGVAKIPIKSVTESIGCKQFSNLQSPDDDSVVGRVLISWRYESNKPKDTEEDQVKDPDSMIGSCHVIAMSARGLRPRKSGAPRNAYVHISFEKQEAQSEPVEGTNDPSWDFGTIFKVYKDSGSKGIIIRVLDMDKIQRPHLGTIEITEEMIENSRNKKSDTEEWLPLQLGGDNPEVNEVGGELLIRFRYKSKADEVVTYAVEIPKEVEEEQKDIEEADEKKEPEYSVPTTSTPPQKNVSLSTIPTTSTPPQKNVSLSALETMQSPEPEQSLVNSSRGNFAMGSQRHIPHEKLSGPFSLDTAINQVSEIYDVLYKIIIIGNSGVGKTNLLGRWLDNKFLHTSATINVEFGAKIFNIDGKIVKVQLWDTAGQEQYRAVIRSYYRKSAGALVVYDITDETSFQKVTSWLEEIRNASGNEDTQILLIGNKSDLEFARKVPTQKGLDLAVANDINFLETSALSGNNVQRAFQIVLQDIHNLNEKKLHIEKPIDPIPIRSTAVVLDSNNTPPQTENTCCGSSSQQSSTQDSMSFSEKFSSLFNSNPT